MNRHLETVTRIISGSILYRLINRFRQWAERSFFVRLLNDERVLAAGAGLFLLFSLVRVLSSGLHVTIQFLSFALLFLVLAAITWNHTEPLSDV